MSPWPRRNSHDGSPGPSARSGRAPSRRAARRRAPRRGHGAATARRSRRTVTLTTSASAARGERSVIGSSLGHAQRRARGCRTTAHGYRSAVADTPIDLGRPVQGDVVELILEDHRRFEPAAARPARQHLRPRRRTPRACHPAHRRTRSPRRNTSTRGCGAATRSPRTRPSTARRSTPRATRRCWRCWSSRAPTPRPSTTRSRSWRG